MVVKPFLPREGPTWHCWESARLGRLRSVEEWSAGLPPASPCEARRAGDLNQRLIPEQGTALPG